VAERQWIFECALVGTGLFGLLGGVFGSVAGAALRWSGRAAGSWIGLTVAQALVHARGRELSPVLMGAVVGGADGACFLGLVGTLVGTVVGYLGEAHSHLLLTVALAMSLLTIGALLFGALAYGLIRAGLWVVAAIFVGALATGSIGFVIEGRIGLFYGALIGAGLGSIIGMVRGGRPRRGTAPPCHGHDLFGQK
jgi:hypothetical protein